MADVAAALSSELNRVLDCSYPACLSHLANLVSTANSTTIRTCIHELPPCQVQRLATLVYEALPLWPYALDILSHLCQSPTFTEKLLLRHPGLLDTLLSKAVSSEQDFNQYATICTTLLFHTLPQCVPLPASAQTFFLRVLEKAVQTPEVKALRPVYHMLRGACPHLYQFLPVENQRALDRQICQVLSSSSDGSKYQFALHLWWFAIVLLIEQSNNIQPVQSRDKASDTGKATWPSSSSCKTAAGNMLFGSQSKIFKTTNLTYLSVILVTKDDLAFSDDEAMESIHIAIRTLRAIDQTVLRNWPDTSNVARSTFAKLYSKVVASERSSAVCFQAITVYAMIAGEKNLPDKLVERYEQCLNDTPSLLHSTELGDTLAVSLPIFASRLRDSAVESLYTGIIDACLSPTFHHRLPTYLVIAEQISSLLEQCDDLRIKVTAVATTNLMQGKTQELLQVETGWNSSICQTFAEILRHSLLSATIESLLTVKVMERTTGTELPSWLALALIKKQRLLSGSNECSHSREHLGSGRASLFQEMETPRTALHLQDWRQRLRSELDSQKAYQTELITRSVARICEDLETRCNTVELPLAQEKERCRELESRIAALKAEIFSLESQAEDGRLQVDGLEDENVDLQNEKAVLQNDNSMLAKEIDELTSKLGAQRREHEEATQRAEKALEDAHEELRIVQLQVTSTRSDREKDIQARDMEIDAKNAAVNELEGQLHDLFEQLGEQQGRNDTLQQRQSMVDGLLESERVAVSAQRLEILQLNDKIKELNNRLESANDNSRKVAEQLAAAESSCQELARTSEEAYHNLKSQCKHDMDQLARECDEQQAQLNKQLTKQRQTTQQVKGAYDETQEELQGLRVTYAEQAEELLELQTWRKNVLASMGLQAQPAAVAMVDSRLNDAAANLATARSSPEPRRCRSTSKALQQPKLPIGNACATNATVEDGTDIACAASDSHLSQTGSTTKRPRSHRRLERHSMRASHKLKALDPHRANIGQFSDSRRKALRHISPNKRNKQADFDFVRSYGASLLSEPLSSSKESGATPQDYDLPNSWEHSILSGTPFTPRSFAAGTGRMPCEDEDPTMTEL